MHSTKENCLPNYGSWRVSVLLGGHGANEVQSAYSGYIHPEAESARSLFSL